MIRSFFTSTNTINKTAFKDKTCRVLLRNQFKVLNRKKLANDYNYRVSFMRFANQYYRLNRKNEIETRHRISPIQNYYFRKRFASMVILMGIVEFLFFTFLIVFKFFTYILTLTYIFFSLTKYVVHPVANYMLYQKTSKNPQYSEHLNTLYDRLNFVINCAKDNAKVTDFFDMYLSEQTKQEIEDFDIPRGRIEYRPLNLNKEEFLELSCNFKPNTQKFYDDMLKKIKEPLPKQRVGETSRKYKYRLYNAKKARREFKKLVQQVDIDSQEHIARLVELTMDMQRKNLFIIDSVTCAADMLNPFDRFDLANKNKNFNDYITFPEQEIDTVGPTNERIFPHYFFKMLLSDLFDWLRMKVGRQFTIFTGVETERYRELTYGYYNTLYTEDSHHVFFGDKKFDKTYRKNQDEECIKDKKKQLLKERYSYLLKHNKKIRDLYNNHAFDQIIEELWTADSGNLNDLLYGPTNWGTIDADTTIFNEKSLYPFMPFFGEHDTDAYLSRYIYNDLYFNGVLKGDENYLSKVAYRRIRRNKTFHDGYFNRGFRYEKNLYYKPKNIITKKKKENVFHNIEYCGSYFLQLDLENFLLYLYYSLKEDNNPLIILIDKFITIFF